MFVVIGLQIRAQAGPLTASVDEKITLPTAPAMTQEESGRAGTPFWLPGTVRRIPDLNPAPVQNRANVSDVGPDLNRRRASVRARTRCTSNLAIYTCAPHLPITLFFTLILSRAIKSKFSVCWLWDNCAGPLIDCSRFSCEGETGDVIS